jgi:hypothetical protein
MLITFKAKADDPVYPIMHGATPTAKEFNKRSAALWKGGTFNDVSFQSMVTILLEIFVDDYDKRHASRKKLKK